MVVPDGLAGRSKATGNEAGNGYPQGMEEGAHRLHAGKNAHHEQDNNGNRNSGKGDAADKANRVHDVGQHVFASAFRRIQARSGLAQKAQ